ncbi:MAG: alpha/beta hydrolase [Pseudomonadota bacterium]
MPSVSHYLLVAMLRVMRRRRLYESIGGMRAGIEKTRRAGPDLPSASVRNGLDVRETSVDGHAVYTLQPKQSPQKAPAPHLLYLHGGAYTRPITRHHWRLIAELVRSTGCTATVPLYPLAPESTCRATLAHVLKVHAGLLQGGAPPSLTLMGDSAGGGMALALAQALRDGGHPMPDQMVLITPWLDVGLGHPDIAHTALRDPMLAVPGAREAGRLYAGDWPLDHPWVSPLHADPSGLPPVTMLVGTRDILGHDAQDFVEKLRAHGVPVQLHEGRDMIHVWPLLPTPEGAAARTLLARILSLSDRAF